jgi:hypothetical protein
MLHYGTPAGALLSYITKYQVLHLMYIVDPVTGVTASSKACNGCPTAFGNNRGTGVANVP